MGVEVELKAFVDDPTSLRSRLDKIGAFRRRYRKDDYYFGSLAGSSKSLFRLRRDDGRWIVTFKKKNLFDGIEHNQETEFFVSDGDAFRRLAEELGYSVVVEKHKTGASWYVDGVVVEVSDVNDLGTYVEVEIVLPDGSGDDRIADARTRLIQVLEMLDIHRDKIESRPYTQMIYENLSSEPTTASPTV